MSNFKGTQGKWLLSGSDKTFVYALNESGTNSFSLNINNDGKTDIEEQQANALLISKAPEMLERLYQQNIDLKVLYGHMLDIEKTNNRADGMSVLIQKWIDENEQLIKEATEL